MSIIGMIVAFAFDDWIEDDTQISLIQYGFVADIILGVYLNHGG